MVVGVCMLELNIPMASSLKDKRRVVKSLKARLRNEYNVSVAEVGRQDSRQVTIIAVVTVSRDKDYAHGLLTRAARWVENSRLDCELVDYEIELI
jgi:uncharacterized protein YlxP (DUF503 family)